MASLPPASDTLSVTTRALVALAGQAVLPRCLGAGMLVPPRRLVTLAVQRTLAAALQRLARAGRLPDRVYLHTALKRLVDALEASHEGACDSDVPVAAWCDDDGDTPVHDDLYALLVDSSWMFASGLAHEDTRGGMRSYCLHAPDVNVSHRVAADAAQEEVDAAADMIVNAFAACAVSVWTSKRLSDISTSVWPATHALVHACAHLPQAYVRAPPPARAMHGAMDGATDGAPATPLPPASPDAPARVERCDEDGCTVLASARVLEPATASAPEAVAAPHSSALPLPPPLPLRHLLHERRVLELGAGTGLAALLMLRAWDANTTAGGAAWREARIRPACFAATDGDAGATARLVGNVALHADAWDAAACTCRGGARVGDVPVTVATLAWGPLPRHEEARTFEPPPRSQPVLAHMETCAHGLAEAQSDAEPLPFRAQEYDVLLGSDLVYDPTCVPPLVQTLASWLHPGGAAAASDESARLTPPACTAVDALHALRYLATPAAAGDSSACGGAYPKYALLCSTLRNPETWDLFVSLLATARLRYADCSHVMDALAWAEGDAAGSAGGAPPAGSAGGAPPAGMASTLSTRLTFWQQLGVECMPPPSVEDAAAEATGGGCAAASGGVRSIHAGSRVRTVVVFV